MLYLGLPLEIPEVMRLFGSVLPPEEVNKFYTAGADDYDYKFNNVAFHDSLKKKATTLRLYYLDKGVWILGFGFDHLHYNLWEPMRPVEESLACVLRAKGEWVNEMTALGIDLSSVTIARMESASKIVQNPQPILVEW